MVEKWLFIITGDMGGPIQVLRSMPDEMRSGGWDARLVCFLGGDKLSIASAPHRPPGNLGRAGYAVIDEYLIMNACRPVDFYHPPPLLSHTNSDQISKPLDLPRCTPWERGDDKEENEKGIGRLWMCNALTVERQPVINFRASRSSASNGVSSTKIRRVMTESPVGDVEEGLKDMVLSVFLLVELLKENRKQWGISKIEIEDT